MIMILIAIRVRNMPQKDIAPHLQPVTTADGDDPANMHLNPLFRGVTDQNSVLYGVSNPGYGVNEPNHVYDSESSVRRIYYDIASGNATRSAPIVPNPMYVSMNTQQLPTTDKSQFIVHFNNAPNLDFRHGSGVPIYPPYGTESIYSGCGNTGYDNNRIKNTPAAAPDGSIA